MIWTKKTSNLHRFPSNFTSRHRIVFFRWLTTPSVPRPPMVRLPPSPARTPCSTSWPRYIIFSTKLFKILSNLNTYQILPKKVFADRFSLIFNWKNSSPSPAMMWSLAFLRWSSIAPPSMPSSTSPRMRSTTFFNPLRMMAALSSTRTSSTWPNF